MKALTQTFALAVLTMFALAASAQSSPPDDAQIAAIVVAANQVDIDAGKLAKERASDKQVKEFAERMITDHKGVNEQAVALVTKLNVTPEENEISQSLTSDGAKTLERLKKLQGKEFDKAYIDNEVTYHQAVLEVIDETLLPNAKNEELKALITQVRPAIEDHLQHAQSIQAELK